MDQSDPNPGNVPAPIGGGGTALLFGGAGVLLLSITRILIPALAAHTQVEPVLLWFSCAGLGLFVPLVVVAIVLLKRESAPPSPGLWRERLRFRPMNRADWIWCLCGLIAIGLLAAGVITALDVLFGEVDLHPSFMNLEPLTSDRYWLLAAWLPFWVVNIMGEEILWRGVLLPRQELAFGRWAWLANGTGWLLFHLPFGLVILFTVAPLTFILPYIVQRRRNTWIGVVLHAALNGPGFVAVAFGLV